MRPGVFLGVTFFFRHWFVSLVTALAVAAPLVVTVLGFVTDQSSRPSPEMQRLAAAGFGSAVLTPLNVSPTAQGAPPADPERVLPGVFAARDLYLDVPAIIARSSTSVNLDQRDWSDPLFSLMLRPVSGVLPDGPDEVAISGQLATRRDVALGERIEVAGSSVQVVGVYDRPFALRSEVVFAPQETTIHPQIVSTTVVFQAFIARRELNGDELARFSPDRWRYQSGEQLAGKRSVFVQQPLAYALALFVALFGTICGAWVLSMQQRRRGARVLTYLGSSRRLVVGGALVEAMCSLIVGTALAAGALLAFAPVVHRATSEAAGIVAEPGWFPWAVAAAVTAGIMAIVVTTATLFGIAISGRVRRSRAVPSTERSRTLEARTRRAASVRSLAVAAMTFAAVLMATCTAILWNTSNRADVLSDPGTRRPGDIEVVLPGVTDLPELGSALESQLGGTASTVKIATSAPPGAGKPTLVAAVDPRDKDMVNIAVPIQVVATTIDWQLLTGTEPTPDQWTSLQAGKLAVFLPELQASPTIDLATVNDEESSSIFARDVPQFAVVVDDVTLNRAKAVVAPGFLRSHGLYSLNQTIVVHTDQPIDQAEAAAGQILTRFGIPGTEIRVGRTVSPSPPLTIIALTVAPAILALETGIFAALAVAIDERRSRRLLTALGARFARRFRFAMGCAGNLTAAGSVLGVAGGIVFGIAIAAALGWAPIVVVPWPQLLGLCAVLVISSMAANAAMAARAAVGRTGQR